MLWNICEVTLAPRSIQMLQSLYEKAPFSVDLAFPSKVIVKSFEFSGKTLVKLMDDYQLKQQNISSKAVKGRASRALLNIKTTAAVPQTSKKKPTKEG